jgi:hypothetical protein
VSENLKSRLARTTSDLPATSGCTTVGFNGLPLLLGRLAVCIEGRPRPGERCVVTSWQNGSDGRRLIAEAALFGEEENLLAVGRAVWVVDRQVQLGKS